MQKREIAFALDIPVVLLERQAVVAIGLRLFDGEVVGILQET